MADEPAQHTHHALDYVEFSVRDVAAAKRFYAAVKSAGGKVVKEPFAFPGGRRFHFEDPSGNELAVWSGA
jgi:predicted enzyme related to lactoylglutathione lyase